MTESIYIRYIQIITTHQRFNVQYVEFIINVHCTFTAVIYCFKSGNFKFIKNQIEKYVYSI